MAKFCHLMANQKFYERQFCMILPLLGPANYPLTETSLKTLPQQTVIFARYMAKMFYAHQLPANRWFATASKFAIGKSALCTRPQLIDWELVCSDQSACFMLHYVSLACSQYIMDNSPDHLDRHYELLLDSPLYSWAFTGELNALRCAESFNVNCVSYKPSEDHT